MTAPSYATARKIRIIESALGASWKENHPNESIDAVYNTVTGDARKNLFCKIPPETKDKLDEMVKHFDIKMSEFIERLIDSQYDAYLVDRKSIVKGLADDYSGR